MMAPERFSDLPEYAFPRLTALLEPHQPGGEVIAMSLGEPQHPIPHFVADIVAEKAPEFGRYPPNYGAPELLETVSDWVQRRYNVALDPETRFMALNGTREGLFNTCLATLPEEKNGERPIVLIPNPFYQVYAVAALEVRAEPYYVPATTETGFLPDFEALPEDILKRTAGAFICSPSNPQGAVADESYWKRLIALAEKYDFSIFADECYSEIYRTTPPTGLLELGDSADPERIVAFHSLSKRSNMPGLRSGFIAAGPKTITAVKQLRSYAGSPLPLPLQHVAIRTWSDEEHVKENRALYAPKYDLVDEVFGGMDGVVSPEAGFFVWIPVEDGEAATVKIWKETGVKVLPGAYLSREFNGTDPGAGYIRAALVAPLDDVATGLRAIRSCL